MKLEESILKVLVYFDLFNYPITEFEIRMLLDQRVTDEELHTALTRLHEERRIYQLDEFISLQNDHSLAERRRLGNQRAAILLNKARNISGQLYNFPFVRAIGVSGSVSKNFAADDDDIDYFIITKANRLWIARTLMHLYKKIPFLKKRKQWYCMNYFVDEASPEIEEKNIYTATDLVTLQPMYGFKTIDFFFAANKWALAFFPNFNFHDVQQDEKLNPARVKKFIEFILNNKIGDWLDNYFLKLTTKRWQLKEKQGRLNTKGEIMGLKTGKHCSKPNPLHFHDNFLKKYEERLAEAKRKWNV